MQAFATCTNDIAASTITKRSYSYPTTTKVPVPFVVVGYELDIAVLVGGHFNKCPYRISSGLAGLVVLGMPSLDDAKSSTLSLIPSFV